MLDLREIRTNLRIWIYNFLVVHNCRFVDGSNISRIPDLYLEPGTFKKFPHSPKDFPRLHILFYRKGFLEKSKIFLS